MPGFTRFRRGVFAIALAAILIAHPAFASDPSAPDAQRKEEATAHLKRGAELIDAEDLQGALTEFEAAYRLVPSPSILHNFGIVYQGLGRKAAALEAFERFLAEADKAPAAVRGHAADAVASLRAEVAELRVEADVVGATIFVDARRAGETPQEKPIYLDPGPHHLSVEKAGLATVHTERMEVRAGQRLTVPARLAARSAPAAEVKAAAPAQPTGIPTHESNGWQPTAAWATAAAATVSAAIFATTFLLRHVRIKEFNDTGCGEDNPAMYHLNCESLLERGRNAEKWAIVSGVATGVLGVGAGLLFLTIPDSPMEISARASGSELGLGLQGRF